MRFQYMFSNIVTMIDIHLKVTLTKINKQIVLTKSFNFILSMQKKTFLFF